jgi:DNA-binding GntR family transcriptional regulator
VYAISSSWGARVTETDNQTHAEKLAGEIADAILSGAFAPGFRLDEQSPAQRYNVSRTPVREALRQLAATGLIEIRPRRGAIVAQVTPAELEEMFVAMGEMEATCARLAAIRMVRHGEPEAFAAANQSFHALIYAGAHNPMLAEFTAGLRRRLAPFRRLQFRTAGRLPRSHTEHEAVVRAILSGDATTAHAAMLHHVSLVEDAFEQFRGFQRGVIALRSARSRWFTILKN